MHRFLMLSLGLVGHCEALHPSHRARASHIWAGSVSLSRKAFVSGSAVGLLVRPLPVLADSKKGYVTLAEYQKLKDQEKKDEVLYGKFESLRERSAQTREFESLAQGREFGQISELARAWDSTIRKEVLETAGAALSGARGDCFQPQARAYRWRFCLRQVRPRGKLRG